MILDLPSQIAVLVFAGVIIAHLAGRMVTGRNFSDLLLMLLMLIFGLAFFLEILYLKWPLLDLALTLALGVTGGLHLLSLLHIRK